MIIRFALCLLVFTTLATAADLVRQTWEVDGVKREALVHLPAVASEEKPAPLLVKFV